jgi:hypothetical protein
MLTDWGGPPPAAPPAPPPPSTRPPPPLTTTTPLPPPPQSPQLCNARYRKYERKIGDGRRRKHKDGGAGAPASKRSKMSDEERAQLAAMHDEAARLRVQRKLDIAAAKAERERLKLEAAQKREEERLQREVKKAEEEEAK